MAVHEETVTGRLHDSRFLGRSQERREDDRLLTGKQTYFDDITVHGTLEAALVRSPFAHARIRSIDASAAMALPGVHLVVTGEDIERDCEPIGQIIAGYQQYPIAVGKVRYAGEPVAFVVADDRYVAEDAAELVKVDYEPLRVVADRDAALRGDVMVDDTKESNIAYEEPFVFGDHEAAFAAADRVIERQIIWRRSCGTPLDTNGALAIYEGDGRFTIHANTQIPRVFNAIIAIALRTASNKLRILTPWMGGSYGTKMNNYRWPIMCAYAARRIGRPVKFKETMVEQLEQGEAHAYDRRYTLRAAFRKDGRMLGYQVRLEEDLGGYVGMLAPAMTTKPISFIAGPFDVPVQSYDVQHVLTNKSPQTAYRGFGSAPHNLALASVMQQAAHELDLPPEEVLRTNFIPPEAFPYTTGSGNQIDSGDYDAVLTKTIALANLDELRARQAQLRTQGRHLGIGVSLGLEPSMFDYSYFVRTNDAVPMSGAPEYVTVTLDNMGECTAFLGTTESGQAYETLLASIVGEELGIDPSRVEVVLQQAADSDGPGFGQGASRMTVMLLGAAKGACDKLKAKMVRVAQHALGTDEPMTVDAGQVFVTGDPERSLPFIAIAGMCHVDTTKLAEGEEPGLKSTFVYDNPSVRIASHAGMQANRMPSYPSMAYAGVIPVVELDPVTGKIDLQDLYVVYDCGTVINPATVEALHHGGIAQAIGAVLYEEFTYSESGQLLANNLWDYGVPTALDMPRIHSGTHETPSPWMPMGAKGAAEGGYIAVPAAVLAAVNDALRPFGARIDEVPITPERVLAALDAARAEGELSMRISETIEVPRPPAEVFERVVQPAAGPGAGWANVTKGAEANCYTAIARVRSGAVRIDLDCAFRVFERVPGSAVDIAGQASSPKLGSTYDVTLTVRPEGTGSAVDVEGRVDISGTLAGLGQRYARHELRRMLAGFLGAA